MLAGALAVLLEEVDGFLRAVWCFFMPLPALADDFAPVDFALPVEGFGEAACGLAVAVLVAGFWEGALLTAGDCTAEEVPVAGALLSDDCVVG